MPKLDCLRYPADPGVTLGGQNVRHEQNFSELNIRVGRAQLGQKVVPDGFGCVVRGEEVSTPGEKKGKITAVGIADVPAKEGNTVDAIDVKSSDLVDDHKPWNALR